jgi:hypothetical protein
MTAPAKYFSLDHMEREVRRGRPRIARKKQITVNLSAKGVSALASIEAAYARAGLAAFKSRHSLIERLIIEHVSEALDLEANIKKHCGSR